MSNILRQQIERFVQLTDDEYEFVLSHFSAKKFKKTSEHYQGRGVCSQRLFPHQRAYEGIPH